MACQVLGRGHKLSSRMRRRALLALLSAAVFVAGCYSDETDFIATRANLYCARLFKCYDNGPDDTVDVCRAAMVVDLEDESAAAYDAGREYDPAAARRCIHAARIKRRACSLDDTGEISEACADVYN